MKPKVLIYTDGACQGNPGPGGWGYLLRCGEHEKEGSGFVSDTTNNRMELQAVVEALTVLKKKSVVDLYTDSQYVRKGMMEWIHAWVKNGWKTASKAPVKNQDIWQALLQLSAQHEITWHWIRGHNGHPENERVDQLAREACKGKSY